MAKEVNILNIQICSFVLLLWVLSVPFISPFVGELFGVLVGSFFN